MIPQRRVHSDVSLMRFLVVLLPALLMLVQSNSVFAQRSERERMKARWRAVRKANEKEIPFRLEFLKRCLAIKKASRDELLDFVDDESDSLAAQAAWELTWRSLLEQEAVLKKEDSNRDKKEEQRQKKDEDKPIDAIQVARFVGFLEGRLHKRIPAWWEYNFMNSQYDPVGDDEYGMWMGFVRNLKESPFYLTSPCFAAPKDIELTYENDVLSMTKGDVTLHIPRLITNEVRQIMSDFMFAEVHDQSLDDPTQLDQDKHVGDKSPIFNFVAHIEKDRYWVGFPDMFATPFTIWCVSCETNEILWRRQTFGGLPGGSGGGKVVHFVSFEADEDRLFVFGSDIMSIYAEAYSKQDGKTLFRFTNVTVFDKNWTPDKD